MDAGTKIDEIEAEIEDLGISPEEVSHLLLTHSDADHVGAAALFSNARIYMSEDEKKMLDGTQKRNLFKYNALPDEIDMTKIEYLGEEEREIGGRQVTSIKVPGHTVGSMAYLIDGEYLFTGDALRISKDKIEVHPFSMDKKQSQESIKKLEQWIEQSDWVFTGHYGYMNRN